MKLQTHSIGNMWKIHHECVVISFIFIHNVNTLKISKPHNPVHHLSSLLSDKNEPLMVVVDTSKPHRNPEVEDLDLGGDDGLVEYGSQQKTDASEDAAYILYHLLRTTKKDDVPDPLLEGTKHLLRQALRVRCKKVEDCAVKCPSVEPYCPVNCQQVFDNLNLCPTKPRRQPRPQKKDRRPKCGKTMPPKWRFKF